MAKKTTNNDATTKLDELASSIKTEHEAVVQTIRKSLDHARKAGELLSKAKEAIKDTDYQWGKWVEKRCGILERTANNYIRIHEKWSEIEAKLKDQGGDLARLDTVNGEMEADALDATDAPESPPERVWRPKRLTDRPALLRPILTLAVRAGNSFLPVGGRRGWAMPRGP